MQKYQNIHINTEKELEKVANMEEVANPVVNATDEVTSNHDEMVATEEEQTTSNDEVTE